MPGSRNRTTRREFFRFKNPDESYGVVRAALGDGRFRVEANHTMVIARIRGNMRGRIYVNVDDVVIIDGEGNTAVRIVKKYTPAEVQMLRDADEFVVMAPSATAATAVVGGNDEGDLGFDFEVI
jgi:initiation factor 1A